jgi:hypothetical protein
VVSLVRSPSKTVAVVIFRDRVTYARECVKRLVRDGLDVQIVDHGSTWRPALRWLARTSLPVHRRDNAHPRDLWKWDGLAGIVGSERYIVTDPDVVPDGWTNDWLWKLHDLLDRHPSHAKAGLALRIDDLPEHYAEAGKVRAWERQWWQTEVEPDVYDAPIDTTLALYRPLSEQPTFDLAPALRLGGPYQATHLTWYEDTANPTDEQLYYRAHAVPGVSHWVDPDRYVGVGR